MAKIMENHFCKFLVFKFFLLLVSVSKGDVDFSCCSPSSYIYNNTCLDVTTNAVTDLNLNTQCSNRKLIRTSKTNFTIESDKMAFKLNPHQKPLTVSLGKACYGNQITNKSNLQNASRVIKICSSEGSKYEYVFVYCSIVTVVFLLLVVIIYASFETLRDLFGWSVINFCASLALGLATYAFLRMVIPSIKTMGFCAAQGFLAYFFMIASFFWLNSISIQVLKDIGRPPIVGHCWSELKYYLLYSWGSPALLTSIMLVVNYHPGDHQKPGIGLVHCWFADITQQWYYMFSVMMIILLINLAIFIYVTTIIWRLSFSSTPIVAVKFKMWLTVKLIILMGLPWILIMISTIASVDNTFTVITDVAVGLQGILIFLVLVVRKRVLKELHQRGLLGPCAGAVERWLARADDAETQAVQHTDVPLHDDNINNGKINY